MSCENVGEGVGNFVSWTAYMAPSAVALYFLRTGGTVRHFDYWAKVGAGVGGGFGVLSIAHVWKYGNYTGISCADMCASPDRGFLTDFAYSAVVGSAVAYLISYKLEASILPRFTTFSLASSVVAAPLAYMTDSLRIAVGKPAEARPNSFPGLGDV